LSNLLVLFHQYFFKKMFRSPSYAKKKFIVLIKNNFISSNKKISSPSIKQKSRIEAPTFLLQFIHGNKQTVSNFS
jgi:hypothetical protein